MNTIRPEVFDGMNDGQNLDRVNGAITGNRFSEGRGGNWASFQRELNTMFPAE